MGKATFLKTLRAADVLDGLFLHLHGTAASDSVEDCGALLATIRELVGPKVAIIASLYGHERHSEDGSAGDNADRREDQSPL